MNNFNLIIDFNNLLMRGISTPGTTFYNSTFEDENDLNDIVKKLTIDICYNIRLFSPSRVIILCDSPNPWRKDILPTGEKGYKANRVKSDERNWTKLWGKMNKFKEHLSNIGFIVSEIDRSEADDLAAMWKEKLFTLDSETILFISSDKDWQQLVDYNNNQFVGIFNPTVNNKGRKKIFFSDAAWNYISTENNSLNNKVDALFDSFGQSNKDNIKNALNSDKKIDIELINPFNVLINKIFEGDHGDNVPSFYEYYKTTKRGTNLARVTQSVIKKLCEELHINNMEDLDGAKKYIVHSLEKIMKIDIPVDGEERLNRQKILVELNTKLFPNNIINKFNSEYTSLIDKIMPKNLSNIKWMDILDNTEFFSKDQYYKPKEDKVFTDLGGDFTKYFANLF